MKVLNYFLDKPHIVFAVIALIFGLILMFIVPKYKVHDETSHVIRTCEVASGIFYNKVPAKETKYDKYFTEVFNIYPHTLYNNGLIKRYEKFHPASGYSPIMYFGSALGLFIADKFTKNSDIIYYSGRLSNLLLFILLCSFAIKLTPILKWQFLFIGLFPVSLFLGMSYSCDSFNLGFALLYFAFLLYLIFSKDEFTERDYIKLLVFAFIGGLTKGVLYPLCLLFFLPKFSNKFKFHKLFYILILFFVTFFTLIYWNNINFKYPNPDFKIIGDYKYIFYNPIDTFKAIFINHTDVKHYAKTLFICFGDYKNFCNPFVYWVLWVLFISNFMLLREKINIKIRIVSILYFFLFYFLTCYHVLVSWMPPNGYLWGVQARYFLPALPLLCITFTQSRFYINRNLLNIYKIILLSAIIFVLIYFCMYMKTYYNPT